MKYLGIHKLLWFLFALFWTTVEIILIGIAYIAYIVWNFKFPKGNLWYNFHSYRSKWDEQRESAVPKHRYRRYQIADIISKTV
jgi:hypothetical protein